MRVLHLLNELRPSGAETMLRIAAPVFAAHGLDNHILALGTTPGDYAPTLAEAGYTIHHLPRTRSPAFLWRLARVLRRIRPDVVHVHTESMRAYLCVIARACGARVVTTYHNCFRFAGFLRLRRRLGRGLIRWIGGDAIAIGASVAACEQEVCTNPCRIIGNWFDPRRFAIPDAATRITARQAFGLSDTTTTFILVGNCSSVKNHGAAFRALARLPADVSWCCLHLGSGSDEAAEQALVQNLGIADRIRFLSRVPDPSTALAAADYFLMPSLYEGLSIAALEAAATGLPLILSNVDGLRDMRGISDHSIHWTGTTPDSILPVLDAACGSGSHLRHVGDLSAFDLHRNVEAYIRVYAGDRTAS